MEVTSQRVRLSVSRHVLIDRIAKHGSHNISKRITITQLYLHSI